MAGLREKMRPQVARLVQQTAQGDPSTPYSGAVSLAATLDNARLLTEGGGPGATHTSFFDNACIRAFETDYLVSL